MQTRTNLVAHTTAAALLLFAVSAASNVAVAAQEQQRSTRRPPGNTRTAPTSGGRGALNLPAPEIFTGRVAQVVDGDTLVVLNDGKRVTVRLAGVDAPQLDQPFGTEARRVLSAAVFGKTVRVEARGRDRASGARIATVFAPTDDSLAAAAAGGGRNGNAPVLVPPRPMDPTGTRSDLPKGLPDPRGGLPERTVARERNIGEEMVRQGLAWADVRQAPAVQSLSALQDEARRARRGLWAQAAPTPPWQFQTRNRRR